jgi:hypothetical protein
MSEITVKIHNSHRLQKRQSLKQVTDYNSLTPHKYTSRNSVYNTYHALEKQKGYDYSPSGRTMKWLKEEFQEKMVKYLGGGTFVKKQGRMDKLHLKEKLNFSNDVNPVIRIFSKFNRIIETHLLRAGFQALA